MIGRIFAVLLQTFWDFDSFCDTYLRPNVHLQWCSVGFLSSPSLRSGLTNVHPLLLFLFVKFLSLMCVWWIFSHASSGPYLIKTNAPALFLFSPPPIFTLATKTPPGWVKIDSLASSARQLRAICSHPGCSSSFCFCDCSSNIIGLEVLERRRGWEGWRSGWEKKEKTGETQNEEWREEEINEI